MNTYPYLAPWLQCLQQLTPPRGLVHIGAGASGGQYPYAAMPSLLVLEADNQHHARLQAQLQDRANCQVRQTVVAGQSGTADFYTLSQTNESGLCPATALQGLWPNIKTLRTETLPCSTLQTLLTQAPGGAGAYNWAVIDCLPAHQIIAGAGDLINYWDVMTLRAFKDNTDIDTQGMCLPALRQQLAAFGLEFVSFEEENHPQMVRALFVRNPAQQVTKDNAALTALQAKHDSLAQENAKLIAGSADLTRARDQLSTQKDAEAKAKAEALAQCDAEAKAKAGALAQRDALAKEKAALTAARDEQAKTATDRQTALTALQARHDILAQEKAKIIADSAELTRARDQLSIQKEAESKAKAEALAQRDSEAKARAEVIAQRDAEAKAKADAIGQRDAEAKARLDAITQRDALAKDKAALIAARDEEARLAAGRQTALVNQQKNAADKLQRLQELEADNQEYAARQQMLQEELIKAEAQIDLIKDLLLREPGL